VERGRKLRIGFPRALFYYSYFPFWQGFFNRLGMEVVVSPPTTKGILDDGTREAEAEACIPVKLYHGHVLALKDKVDLLFIPRLVRIDRRSTFCPKFLGLPDMVRASLPGLPPILDLKVDERTSPGEWWPTCRAIGELLGIDSFLRLWSAYREGKQHQKAYEKLLYKGYLPEEALAALRGEEVEVPPRIKENLNLAVLGYPYQVYDGYISWDIIGKLRKMPINLWTMEMVPPSKLYRFCKHLPKQPFWHYSVLVLGAAYYYQQQGVDGVIHVAAFACGPDAMVNKIMEIDLGQGSNPTPFMSLSVDEQTGDAGVATRLEAFVDMLLQRRRKG